MVGRQTRLPPLAPPYKGGELYVASLRSLVSAITPAAVCLRWCAIIIAIVFLSQPSFAGNQAPDEDDDEQKVQYPGIWGTYSAAGKSISRRDADVAFVWGEQSPVQQLPAGPFEVQWQGKLLIRPPGKYRFHARVQGQLEVTFNGQKVLEASTKDAKSPQWVSGPEAELEYGQHPLSVSFRSTGPQSSIKLYWSCDGFAFEPIPTGAYFLNEAHPEYELESRGRELFAAHRCNRCHHRENDPPSPAGPDLTHVASGLQGDWIERWLAGDRQGASHSWMPEFGFSKDESNAIAAFLRHQSDDVQFTARESVDAKPVASVAEGKKLFFSMGCLACHSYGKVGTDGHFGGGDLANIGAKRTPEWLWVWLADPKRLNADHHMPIFDWKDKTLERKQLVAFLSESRSDAKPPTGESKPTDSTPDQIKRGQTLVEAARCASCHRLNGLSDVKRPALPVLDQPDYSAANTCLQAKPNREKWRPAFPKADVGAIRAFLKARAGTLVAENPVERGQRLLTWNNCLQCHPRDSGGGLGQHTKAVTEALPELEGQAPTLVPPRLNAVGDKLLDEALRKAVAGELPSRMTWLKVKMPRFRHSDEDRAALANYFAAHDRIDAPPNELANSAPTPTGEQHKQALAAGNTLIGSQGFSCIACHQFGKFTPRNTALGTRGSDLLQISQRMRREYFLRWTRSPIRIVPDMEMPGYERPLPGLLGGDIQRQLVALWEGVNDPNANQILDVASVQQSFVVKPGEPARIVRDVFLIREPGGGSSASRYIPRTFVVGFNSQHNILFDLDTMQVAAWWQGDLGRQRTEGKSWNWVPGNTLLCSTTLLSGSGLAFLPEEQKRIDLPPLSTFNVVSLKEYQPSANGVRLTYRIAVHGGVIIDGGPEVEVTEEWQPIIAKDKESASGWSRKIALVPPEGFRPIFLRPGFKASASEADGDIRVTSALKWIGPPGNSPAPLSQTEYALLTADDQGRVSGQFNYLAKQNEPVPGVVVPEAAIAIPHRFTTVPGYAVTQLPLPQSIMPTAMTWTKDGTLAFASLKGHIYKATDSDGNGLEDKLIVFEEGLAAPYGIISDPVDDSLIVSHKPELLRLIDTNGDGRADVRKVFATGWGYNDNYHDWTCGIVRDSKGNLYVGLGSDYTQPKRPASQQLWRGKILRISPYGKATPIASGLRYPTGLAMNPDDELFVSDNQGEQNVFNELNHIVEGEKYGVPSREDPKDDKPASLPAIQIPHPWTRSINGIFFIPREATLGAGKSEPHPFAGHGIGCEYDSRFLIRFTLQKVGDTIQGAVYALSQDHLPPGVPNFEGTLCGGVSPKGDIYIGCIHDSGWLGGLNVGSIVKLQSTGSLPLGIREIQATPHGFQLDFTAPIDRKAAEAVANYTISAYTRKWQGTYATPDSDRHQVAVTKATVSDDGRRVVLQTDKLRIGYVYEVSCGKIGTDRAVALWPATGHYTVNRVPVEK